MDLSKQPVEKLFRLLTYELIREELQTSGARRHVGWKRIETRMGQAVMMRFVFMHRLSHVRYRFTVQDGCATLACST